VKRSDQHKSRGKTDSIQEDKLLYFALRPELAGKRAAPFSGKRSEQIFQWVDVKQNDEEQNGIQGERRAVLEGVSTEEFVVRVPEQREESEANGERNKSAHGNTQLTEIFRDLQRHNEKRKRQSKNYVAEDLDARDRCAAQAEPSFRVPLRIVNRHCCF
jgi:hypothetical protein